MRPFIAIAVFLVAAAGTADDSPLVKAAKANGGPKKKTTKKVITNADVTKSSDKKTATPAAKPAAPPAAAPAGSIAEQDKLLHDRAAAKIRSDAAQAKLWGKRVLRKELGPHGAGLLRGERSKLATAPSSSASSFQRKKQYSNSQERAGRCEVMP
jgi:hypothetical protein